MSPLVRGRIIPETESTGRAKRNLEVLLWLPRARDADLAVLDRVQTLRDYLAALVPPPCEISLQLPFAFRRTAELLAHHRIPISRVEIAEPTDVVRQVFQQGCPNGLSEAASTALNCNADLIVAVDFRWLPYFEEFDKLNTRIVESEILERQCEIFVRGHDVPWSFNYMVYYEPWTAFYQMGEPTTFKDGFLFLNDAYNKSIDPATQDSARMLIHNRLPNLCFTRDRLLFYELQQAAAQRARWQRQDFVFEASYYLNFYYLLLYGGFDHLVVVVNGALRLGLPERQIGVANEIFLKNLQSTAPEIHAIFVDSEFQDFVQRTGALRHFAAHRGSIMPGKLLEKPDVEPTDEQLDREIASLGLDHQFRFFPAGPLRDQARDLLRYKVKLSKYKELAEGVVPLKMKGKSFFIRPMADIEWNFAKFQKVMVAVLDACAKRI